MDLKGTFNGMVFTGTNEQKKNKLNVETTFPIPFPLGEVKEENNIIWTKVSSEPSKEQIISQAFNFHKKGDSVKAAKLYKVFIDKGYKDYRVFSNYGAILKDIKRFKEAEFFTRKAIEINPDFAMSYFNLGNILNETGHVQEAEISMRKAIQINPDLAAEAYSILGNILNNLSKSEEAEIFARKALKMEPNCENAHVTLGTILQSKGKLKEAETIFSKAIKLKPGWTTPILKRCQLYFEKGEFDLALKDADSCNTKVSRAAALEILYALGKIDEIYNRIEKTSRLDEKNIRLAAFSSFIAEQEKKKTSNNFCPNPLSFLHYSNLNLHLQDYVEFIEEIVSELTKFDTVWQIQDKATHNGFQTPRYMNLFSNSSKKVSQLKSIILDELDKYYLKYAQDNCSYIQEWPSKKQLFAWQVILKKQGYQEAHIHPDGWLSGVIYLKVVPSLDNNEGAIEFSLNGGAFYSNTNSPKLTYEPKAGDIVLFPSSLHHRTIPFSTDTDRIVIAFDLMPN